MKLTKELLPKAHFIGSFTDNNQMPSDYKEVCFIGRSNSGKSSLLSSLCSNSSIVKTSKKPGSTRTINFFKWREIYMVDLPGYGYATASHRVRDDLSNIISRYIHEDTNLFAGFLLLDCYRKPEEEELYIANLFKERSIPLILLYTKVDRVNQKDMVRIKKQNEEYDKLFFNQVYISSKKNINLDFIYNYLISMGA